MDTWLKGLAELTETVRATLLPSQVIEDAITLLLARPDSPLRGLRLTASIPPFPELAVGRVDQGPASLSKTISDLACGGSARVDFWQVRPNSYSPELERHCIDLARACAMDTTRDQKTALPSLQKEPPSRLDSTLKYLYSLYPQVAIVFADLDRFKSVNDSVGEQEGDRIIQELAIVLQECGGRTTSLVHRSGDEFVALIPVVSHQEVLEIAKRMMTATREHDFRLNAISLSLSMGIVFASSTVGAGWNDLEHRAEKALKPEQDKKRRGCATLVLHNDTQPPPNAPVFAAEVAVVVVKSLAANLEPFANPWLNLLSSLSTKAAKEATVAQLELTSVLKSFSDWARPCWRSSQWACLDLRGQLKDCAISVDDALVAMAHGIFRAALNQDDFDFGELSIEREGGAHLTIDRNTVCQATGVDSDPSRLAIHFGGAVKSTPGCAEGSSKRAVLVQIGHELPTIPIEVFSDVIISDDRPTRGGGLPDFWEASLARLCDKVVATPTANNIFVFGEERYASLLVENLKDVDSWTRKADQLAYKTATSAETIRHVAQQVAGRIHFCPHDDKLVRALADLLRPASRVDASLSVMPSRLRFAPRLHRDLRKESLALGLVGGCRVRTIADAFPAVLEIVRTEAPTDELIDQSGQPYRELVDFRVLLTTPTVDQVPDFYVNETASLGEYFQKQFCQPGGLFHDALSADGQLDAVLGHIAESIRPTKQVATRRAILVVPHKIQDGANVSPLGLVSIRILPRYTSGAVHLSFSFTWRTVEALVGFPYSLYGSVRYAEYLRNLVVKKAGGMGPIEMDEVSYVAHSLHYFTDPFRSEIARRIVSDATA